MGTLFALKFRSRWGWGRLAGHTKKAKVALRRPSPGELNRFGSLVSLETPADQSEAEQRTAHKSYRGWLGDRGVRREVEYQLGSDGSVLHLFDRDVPPPPTKVDPDSVSPVKTAPA